MDEQKNIQSPGGTKPKRRNTWSKLRDADTPEAKRKLEAWRERFKAHELVAMLKQHAEGVVDKSPTQIKAIEIILDRLEPRLSAVEATHLSPDAQKSPEELRAELVALLKSDPSIAREAGFVPGPPRPVDNAAQHEQTTVDPSVAAA